MTQGDSSPFAYGAITLYGPAFQTGSARREFCNSPAGPWPSPVMPHYPAVATPTGLTQRRFRLFPFRSPLLRESRLLSFPPGTEMFQFPGLAS